jgi:molecular chaperone GrpE (heat shock protein)
MGWEPFLPNNHSKQEEFEDTKGAIRICISKKNRQYNGQKKKYKRINNDLNKLRLRSERRNQVLFLFFRLLHS